MSIRASLLVLVFALPAAASPQVIDNSAEPAEGLQILRLEELWRAGGPDDDVLFGHIFRAEGDAEGNVYLLDTQLSEVPVFAPDGTLVKTLSREGEGPGETRSPVDLSMLPDGNVGILQRFPGKLVCIDREGAPRGEIVFGDPEDGGFHSAYTARCKNGHLMVVGQSSRNEGNVQTRTWWLAGLESDGRESSRPWSQDLIIDFSQPVLDEETILHPAMFAATPGPDGCLYLAADRAAYAIDVYGPDGALQRTVRRQFEPRPKLPLEKNRLQAVFDVWASRNPAGLETHVEEIAATITDLHVTDDNLLWVEHSRSAETGPEEAFLTYDVFGADGRYLRRVALVCEGNPLDDELFWVRDDMVVIVKGAVPAMYASMAGGGTAAEDAETMADEMEVVCYRLPR